MPGWMQARIQAFLIGATGWPGSQRMGISSRGVRERDPSEGPAATRPSGRRRCRARTVAGESPEAAEWDMYWRITGRAAAYVRSPFHFCERFVGKSECDESPTLWMAAERSLVCARPRRAWLRLDLAYEFRKTA